MDPSGSKNTTADLNMRCTWSLHLLLMIFNMLNCPGAPASPSDSMGGTPKKIFTYSLSQHEVGILPILKDRGQKGLQKGKP